MKIKKMTDEECLQKFLEFLRERVSIKTLFVQDEHNNLTHQVLEITCGEFISVSDPQPLAVVLRPASGEEIGATVN